MKNIEVQNQKVAFNGIKLPMKPTVKNNNTKLYV